MCVCTEFVHLRTWASPPSGPDAQVGPNTTFGGMTERSIFIVDAVPVRRKWERTSRCVLTNSCVARTAGAKVNIIGYH